MKISTIYFLIPFILNMSGNLVDCENFLFLMPLATRSHRNIISPLITALATKGHLVTLVLPDKSSKVQKNVREIVPTNFSSKMEQFGNPLERRSESNIIFFYKLFNLIVEGCHEAYGHLEFMQLLNEHFDLVFITSFLNDCFDGFLYKLNAPFIILSTTPAPSYITSIVGNRLPPSFIPVSVFDYTHMMNFKERFFNFIAHFLGDFVATQICQIHFENIYKNYLGQDLPDLQTILKNTSMIFMNSHHVLTYPRLTLPDVIEIGGMHCQPAKSLPHDLEEFVGGSDKGFIYFSLGSLIQAKSMSDNTRKIFLTVFSRLEQRVLWKWEEETMENLPQNVKLAKWVPQQDILGHSNIKLFLTHGGLLSVQEACFHGVPLVGMPLFADQNLNLKQAQRAGFSLTLEFLELTVENLEFTIRRVLEDEKFGKKAKEISKLFRDQLETPLERAVFWAEYVIRRKGKMGPMRSAARDLNFFQYHSLDVITFLGFSLLMIVWLIKNIVVRLCRQFFSKTAKLKSK